jgi:hypothetical protein
VPSRSETGSVAPTIPAAAAGEPAAAAVFNDVMMTACRASGSANRTPPVRVRTRRPPSTTASASWRAIGANSGLVRPRFRRGLTSGFQSDRHLVTGRSPDSPPVPRRPPPATAGTGATGTRKTPDAHHEVVEHRPRRRRPRVGPGDRAEEWTPHLRRERRRRVSQLPGAEVGHRSDRDGTLRGLVATCPSCGFGTTGPERARTDNTRKN